MCCIVLRVVVAREWRLEVVIQLVAFFVVIVFFVLECGIPTYFFVAWFAA